MSEPRDPIVFTGSGIVCGAGGSVAEVWEKLAAGKTAVRPFSQFDPTKWPVGVASEVLLTDRELVSDRKLHKTISRTDMFGIYAAERALEESGLPAFRDALSETEQAAWNDRTGLVVGTGGGNYCSNYDFLPLMTEAVASPEGEMRHFGKELGNQVTPMWLLKNLPNNVLCHVGIRGQYKGTNACITNQCVSGLLAVAEAACAIRNGEADRAAAVGHDSPFEPEMLYYYHKLGLMSGEAPRPFDASRDGTVFGEGAAALVLERASEAKARGASILGEFLGFGCCNEAAGILELSSDGEGVERAIEEALASAGLSKDEVGMVCAHGNGNQASDATEAMAVRRVFGDDAPPVTAFKWCYGHLIAASGIVDLAMALEALGRGLVPGLATLDRVDPAIAPFSASREARAPRGDVALVVCRGFGGTNVAFAVRAGRRG